MNFFLDYFLIFPGTSSTSISSSLASSFLIGLYKLYLDERINKAQKQMKEGNYLTHEEAKERLKNWLI